ncbi:PREDICTED: uncharacterized protein LOC105152614 [Acromyrmex echinatior]|uniref:uncharacterized protein LOC105152614 n=1 Tax=Acromyrmex echinatior TaxID=103372 RepID=UPI000580E71D|nr:PREDICTED: uncharacterized protein LOC105152614 [Acromyrmex echinatior]
MGDGFYSGDHTLQVSLKSVTVTSESAFARPLTTMPYITALFLTLNYICQTVYCKVNETVTILHKLSNYNLDEDLSEQIFQFILQIKLMEVKFGIGLFYFGYSSICEVHPILIKSISIYRVADNCS